VCTFFRDGALLEKHEDGEDCGERSEDEEAVEIGEREALLLAQIVQGLHCHSVRRDRIAALLEEPGCIRFR
jgi:hypothetical protein